MKNEVKGFLNELGKLPLSDRMIIVEELKKEFNHTRSIDTKYGKVQFTIDGEMSNYRVDHFFDDEPEMFEWIETFDENDTIWDIGANIGTYSTYMALKGHNIFAFEPISSNFYLLNKNIKLNELTNISSHCLAFSNQTIIDNIFMQFDKIGWACNNFGDNLDWKGEPFNEKAKETVTGYTIDDFIKYFKLDVPNHIKIDVDGIEDKIIEGAYETLRNKNLKSIYIELTDSRKNYTENVIKMLNSSGFEFIRKDNMASHHDSIWDSTFNYVFKRK